MVINEDHTTANVYISLKDLETISKAAKKEKRSRSSFMVFCALNKANEVLK